jgi:hypothetical protein
MRENGACRRAQKYSEIESIVQMHKETAIPEEMVSAATDPCVTDEGASGKIGTQFFDLQSGNKVDYPVDYFQWKSGGVETCGQQL